MEVTGPREVTGDDVPGDGRRGPQPRDPPVHAGGGRPRRRSSSASAWAAATQAADAARRRSRRPARSRSTPPSRRSARGLQRGDVAARQDHRLREAGPRGLDQRRGGSRRRADPGRPRSCATTSPAGARGAGTRTRRPRRAPARRSCASLAKTLEELAAARPGHQRAQGRRAHLVADLVQKTEADLDDVKNLGDKSIDEIKTALAALGLSLGMRIDPNVLGALGRAVRRSRNEASARAGLQARAAHPAPVGDVPQSPGRSVPPRAHRDHRGQGQGGARTGRPRDHAGQAREPPRAPAGAQPGARHESW